MIITAHCRKHPRYKVERAPRVECRGCVQLWEMREAINGVIVPGQHDSLGALDHKLHFLGVRTSECRPVAYVPTSGSGNNP